ncbi:exonuclease domain-containing protein [Thalassotalea maritima]|uniref:exonuclease domain-containing protein n=1 Tax=Thalassotalea maritima TaxID=3242416 RepID=UPI00352947A3
MQDYLSVPLPSPKLAIVDVPIVSLDFETTGLNPRQDNILSIGHVNLQHWQIDVASASHYIIKQDKDLNSDNVIVHHITDQQMQDGISAKQALATLLNVLAGKVLLVHFATIELRFLKQACIHYFGFAPIFATIDTMLIAKRRFDMRDISYDPSQLRLMNLRARYQLPKHHAHNALSDALATAELFMAQVCDSPQNKDTPLSHFLRY